MSSAQISARRSALRSRPQPIRGRATQNPTCAADLRNVRRAVGITFAVDTAPRAEDERAGVRFEGRRHTKTDVVLVGAGIMSATLGVLLRLVQPDWSITLVERLDAAAAESSDPEQRRHRSFRAVRAELHAGECRRHHRHRQAIGVNEQFQMTRQFWAYAHENGILPDVRSFLNPDSVRQLRAWARCRRPSASSSRNPGSQSVVLDDGVHRRPGRVLPPVATDGGGPRLPDPVALNWTRDGTDVDFGALSKQLLGFCTERDVATLFGHEVRDLHKESDGSWTVKIVNRRTGEKRSFHSSSSSSAPAAAHPLLQKAE